MGRAAPRRAPHVPRRHRAARPHLGAAGGRAVLRPAPVRAGSVPGRHRAAPDHGPGDRAAAGDRGAQRHGADPEVLAAQHPPRGRGRGSAGQGAAEAVLGSVAAGCDVHAGVGDDGDVLRRDGFLLG